MVSPSAAASWQIRLMIDESVDALAEFTAQIEEHRLALSSAEVGNVVTIEGLSADRSHPAQKAWIENQVPQCGYCQPGMLMCAAGAAQP